MLSTLGRQSLIGFVISKQMCYHSALNSVATSFATSGNTFPCWYQGQCAVTQPFGIISIPITNWMVVKKWLMKMCFWLSRFCEMPSDTDTVLR